jgi:hypothetical protein
MKQIFAILLLTGVLIANAAPPVEPAKVPTRVPAIIELNDQFDAPQKISFPTTNITLLTIADRSGSDQIAGWVTPVKKQFDKRVDIRGIADMSSVPGPLRGFIRKKFQKAQTYPVMMDWVGATVKAITYVPEKANVLVLDGRGKILLRISGAADEKQIKELCEVIEHALAERDKPVSAK